MKNLVRVLFVASLLVALSPTLRAQTGVENGCTDSPENPTAVLALVGGAGAGLGYLRQYLRKRKGGS